ncbi:MULTISPECIES: ABC transporter substrate-binding protein [Kitasatospora]|uniref:Iron-siderophore ABC transporter substrate-binding protein n=1 Tax=Kitasatospora cathayae TaxID=3004092 RepID=A0ABY7Q427_9ACTN|nr:iron-siderophore ABC transporter substrate-binding protein [Kitasatospora sp. HUAS 3-15]WBP87463.1 iron-siderophore ABC transporter substrate-binding protein [Kitasatospora sp. HUAS 3-15]
MPRIARRTLLAGLGGAALTACTSSSGGSQPPTPDGIEATGSPSPAPVPPVTVNAANGPVLVPGEPQRVVVLDTDVLDSALTLGITPVGAALPAADTRFPDYWPASRTAEIRLVGPAGAPDLAAVRALRPDLILSNQSRDGDRYDQLRGIAPTVLTQTSGAPWKVNFQLHAQALSRVAAAAAFVTAYQKHAGQVAQTLSEAKLSGRRVSLVRFVEGGGIRLFGRQSFPGIVLADAGVARPDAQNVDQSDFEIPLDQLAKADGDLLLYATYGDPARAGTDATLASPDWQALGAVKAHRVLEVDDQLWFQGIGYTGANFMLDELQRFLGA